MEIIALDSPVFIGDGKVEATVVGVSLNKKGVTYLCVWWDGNIRHEEWVWECEVVRRDGAKATQIGFRK